MSRFSWDTDPLKTYSLFTCKVAYASWMTLNPDDNYLYIYPLITWLGTIVPAAKCLGEYLLVIGSSLLSGHCPTKHFRCINSPTAFSRSARMMRKTIRTHCLNKYTITTTIAILIPSFTAFRQIFFYPWLLGVKYHYRILGYASWEQKNEVTCPRSYRRSIREIRTKTLSAWLNWVLKILQSFAYYVSKALSTLTLC